MINNLRNKITYRKGFIIGVLILVTANVGFIVFYLTFFLNSHVNETYSKTTNELYEDLDFLEEQLKKEDNYDSYLKEYIKEKKVNIFVYDENNKLINSYINFNNNNSVTAAKTIKNNNNIYLIKMSKARRIINLKYGTDFLAFEIINILLLTLAGIYISNMKLLKPITELSEDIDNYKLGIKPKKRPITSGIDNIQNEFVDLVDNLEESKQKESRIIASISHDIKTPLTSILGYSERLATSKLTDEQKNKYINTIHDKAINLKEITDEFDSYLSANIKDESKIEKITIKTLIDYLNNYYKEDLKEKNIDFKIKTNCNQTYIKVDLSKFKRVFSNIITNSIRYLDKNKKLIIITINEEKNGKIVFEIADNGSGTKENLESVFEPLYTTDKSRKISGLGLSIVKEIIISHDGTIKAANNKMGGFSIIFTIDSYKED